MSMSFLPQRTMEILKERYPRKDVSVFIYYPDAGELPAANIAAGFYLWHEGYQQHVTADVFDLITIFGPRAAVEYKNACDMAVVPYLQ